jgi:hypothetical protein
MCDLFAPTGQSSNSALNGGSRDFYMLYPFLNVGQPAVYFLFCRVFFDFLDFAVHIGGRKHIDARAANQKPQIPVLPELLMVFIKRIPPHGNVLRLKGFAQLIKTAQAFGIGILYIVFIHSNFSILFCFHKTATT